MQVFPFHGKAVNMRSVQIGLGDNAARLQEHAPCRLCTLNAGSDLQPWHVLNECDNIALAASRIQLNTVCTAFIGILLNLFGRAARHNATVGRSASRTQQVCESVAAAAVVVREALLDWTWDDVGPPAVWTHFLRYRLVAGLPFAACMVREPHVSPGTPVAPALVVALGRLFEAVILPRSELRMPCDRWVEWSDRQIRRLAQVYRREADLLPPLRPAAPATPGPAAAQPPTAIQA